LAAVLSAAKRFNTLWVRNSQEWACAKMPSADLRDATLGLIGFGAIGQKIAELAQGLGMRVVAVRRSNPSHARDDVDFVATVAEVLRRADHAVLAAPATAETRHIINADTLSQAKPGLHLINLARGALVDNDALLAALDAGIIGFATLDVTDPEPLPDGHPFYTHPRIRLSPHVSMFTESAFSGLIDKFADNLERFRQGLPLRDVVDVARGY
jgi:phosphoglycerate dehydrogenase-like enzyme